MRSWWLAGLQKIGHHRSKGENGSKHQAVWTRVHAMIVWTGRMSLVSTLYIVMFGCTYLWCMRVCIYIYINMNIYHIKCMYVIYLFIYLILFAHLLIYLFYLSMYLFIDSFSQRERDGDSNVDLHRAWGPHAPPPVLHIHAAISHGQNRTPGHLDGAGARHLDQVRPADAWRKTQWVSPVLFYGVFIVVL